MLFAYFESRIWAWHIWVQGLNKYWNACCEARIDCAHWGLQYYDYGAEKLINCQLMNTTHR
jgi:hypothetical protein